MKKYIIGVLPQCFSRGSWERTSKTKPVIHSKMFEEIVGYCVIVKFLNSVKQDVETVAHIASKSFEIALKTHPKFIDFFG